MTENRVWWYSLVSLALVSLRQENGKFKVNQCYIVRSCLKREKNKKRAGKMHMLCTLLL